MAFLRSFMVSSLIISTSVLASSEPAFAGRYDHQCQAYKSHGSVAVCVQWMKRKLGSIRPGKCYEWQISKIRKNNQAKIRKCVARNQSASMIRVYPYAGAGARPARPGEWLTRDISSECEQMASHYLGRNRSYWATMNSYTGGSIPDRYRVLLKFKLSEYCKAYYQ